MTELEQQLLKALDRLSSEYAEQLQRQNQQIEALSKRIGELERLLVQLAHLLSESNPG